jgi:tetratricopeptide (TPR) repeat protein
LAYEGLGKLDEATDHFSQAIKYDAFSSQALVFRAAYFNRHKQYDKAKKDLEDSLRLATEKYEIFKQFAKAHAGLGDWELAFKYTQDCFNLDPGRAKGDIVDISKSFWEESTQYAKGVQYYLALRRLVGPTDIWNEANIKNLSSRIAPESRSQVR